METTLHTGQSLGSLLGGKVRPGTRRIVALLGARGPMTPGEIAEATGLARSTVSMVLSDLRQSGAVVEAEASEPRKGVGRPSIPIALNPSGGTCVGIHLGLSEVDVLVADIGHNVLSRGSAPIALDYSPEEAAREAKRLVEEAFAAKGLDMSGLIGVGVSVSSPVDAAGTIMHSSILPNWAGLNVREVFEPVFGRPVFAENESNCAAIAEMTWGAAQGCPDFVFFTVDVGVGGAIVQGGRLVSGLSGGAGEFGHICIEPDGPLCRCGNRGCLEISASVRGPLADLSLMRGREVTLEEAIDRARAGDPPAIRMIEDVALRAGRGLAMIGTILDPPLIILGGRMARAGDLFRLPLAEAYARGVLIKPRTLPEDRRARFITGHFPGNDCLMGAVGVVLRGIGQAHERSEND